MNFKNLSLGLKVICVVLLLSPVPYFMLRSFHAAMLQLPEERKLDHMEKGDMRFLNPRTVETFDQFWREEAKSIQNDWIVVSLQFLLGLSVMFLRKWVWVALLIFFTYAAALRIMTFGGLTTILALVYIAWCFYYLLLPEVIKKFK